MTRLRVLASAFACSAPGTPGFTGGESALGWNLLRQIARYHEVWALTRAIDQPSIESALKDNPVPNLHFHYLELPKWSRLLLKIQGGHQLYYWLWQIRAYFVGRSLHKTHQFDLFHHITYANDWMTSPMGAFLPVPYVRGPGGGAHRTPKGLVREYSFSGRLWEKARALGQWIFRHDPTFLIGQKRAKALLVCNQEALSNIPNRWQLKAQLFPVNGITADDLNISPTPDGDETKFRILSAGTLIRIKGFALAIKSFDNFAKNHSDAELTIIGSGPEGPKLEALVQDSATKDQINLVPNMPRDELLRRMAGCDVFLFPSLRDGGGAVVVEAMAAGKPVVCLDCSGPGTHVTAESGIKIQPTSAESTVNGLAQALEKLYLDGELRLQLGTVAKQRAADEYHWNKLGDRLMAIYEDALGPVSAG